MPTGPHDCGSMTLATTGSDRPGGNPQRPGGGAAAAVVSCRATRRPARRVRTAVPGTADLSLRLQVEIANPAAACLQPAQANSRIEVLGDWTFEAVDRTWLPAFCRDAGDVPDMVATQVVCGTLQSGQRLQIIAQGTTGWYGFRETRDIGGLQLGRSGAMPTRGEMGWQVAFTGPAGPRAASGQATTPRPGSRRGPEGGTMSGHGAQATSAPSASGNAAAPLHHSRISGKCARGRQRCTTRPTAAMATVTARRSARRRLDTTHPSG